MLNRYARALFTRAVTPIARVLLAAGIGPDLVTAVGTLGVVVGALTFYPRGEFLAGTLVILVFVFFDLLDGTMARLAGRSSRWGAFLDSTLDRVGDASVFGGLVLWYAGAGHDPTMAAVALVALVAGAVVSYARARAEGLGMTADVGIAERAERLVVVLLTTGLAGLGVPYVQPAGVWLVAVAGVVTVVQRVVVVRRQSVAEPDGPTP
ncbi:MAG: phosphatidylinositol phosphate synthase [Actinomycetes bacterium]